VCGSNNDYLTKTNKVTDVVLTFWSVCMTSWTP